MAHNYTWTGGKSEPSAHGESGSVESLPLEGVSQGTANGQPAFESSKKGAGGTGSTGTASSSR